MDYYRDGLSKTLPPSIGDNPSKFSFLTPIEDVLKGSKRILVYEGGQLDLSSVTQELNLIVDARKSRNIQQTVSELLKVANQVYGITLNAALMDDESMHHFISVGLMSGKFVYLVDIDLSYINISYKNLHEFCKFVNPVVSGYNPMKRLSMTRCNLGVNGTKYVVEACIGNNFIEELYLTGNQATDEVSDSLVRLLQYSESRLKAFGFGDNLLSSQAVANLAPFVESHKFLSVIQLQDNPICDEGAAAIFRSIRDKHLVEKINFRACRVEKCTWSGRLSVISSLIDLNLSYNNIDDEGFVNICDGLNAAYSIRHLDLSYNKFGGLICMCIGKTLSENRSLYTLNLSGNKFHHDVLSVLADGIVENVTLVQLNLHFCNLSSNAVGMLRKALASNSTCDVLMDFNPIPDTLRSDSRFIEPGLESIPVHPQYRSNFVRAERDREAFLAKRHEVMKKASGDNEDFEDTSVFSGPFGSVRSINSIDTESVNFDGFSGDLRVWSERDKGKEKIYNELKDSRISIVARRIARRKIRKTHAEALLVEKAAALREDLPVKANVQNDETDEAKFVSTFKTSNSKDGNEAEIYSDVDEERKVIESESEKNTNILSLRTLQRTSAPTYAMSEISLETIRGESVTDNKKLLQPIKLANDSHLTSLVAVLEFCSMKVREIQRSRLALEVLKDLDAELADDRSLTSLEEKGSLTSQHLVPRLAANKFEREEEKKVTMVDEDRGIFRELIVTYGNRLENIGVILVEDSTTYYQAKAMVKGMVRKYFASTFQILNEKEAELSNTEGLSSEEREKKRTNLLVERDSLENLVENFVLADANGKPVTGLGSKMRVVWSELSRNDCYLEIIPANGFGILGRGRRSNVGGDIIDSISVGMDSMSFLQEDGDDDEYDHEDDGFS